MINIEKYKKIRAERHLIVLDTNILLELYRQPANISLDVISALTHVMDNLYIPRQVYEEYLRNYKAICGGEKKKYQKVSNELTESTRKLQEDINTKTTEYRKHNYTDITKLQTDLEDKISDIQSIIKEFEQNHKSEIQSSLIFLKNDKVKEFIDLLVSNGKIENVLSFSQRLAILQEGKIRFDNQIPPGYMDIGKEGADKYGDLFVWKSIIKEAKEKNSNIVFVCNDTKEDWWEKDGDTLINLRKELLDEFKEQNPFLDVNFMTLDKFFSYLAEELHIGKSKSALQLSAIEDIEKILADYDDKIVEKINEYLLTMDIQSEIDEDFIEIGDKEKYWEIDSVSVEKEGKIITYYITLNISVIVDLSFKEPGNYPYKAGKEVIEIAGKLKIVKEEYATACDMEGLEISLVEMEHIEPEVWNIIKQTNSGDSAKKIISANSGMLKYQNNINNFREGLNNFARILEPYSTIITKTDGLQEMAKAMDPVTRITKPTKGLQEMAKAMDPVTRISKHTKE